MPSYSKGILSGSTNGRLIKIAATSSPGTLIHTAGSVTGDDNADEIYLGGVNSDTTARKLTIEWGGTTSPDDLIEITIEPEAGLVDLIPGWVLNNGLVLRAFAATADVILVGGFYNKIRA
jgi:hypothetical protein